MILFEPVCRHLGLFIFCLAMALSAGCGSRAAGDADRGSSSSSAEQSNTFSGAYPYKIVTTCGMVTDIVRQVAGDQAEVTGIMGEGIDPHLYKPTRDDVKQLIDADVIFYSGLMLEGRMGDTFVKVARAKPVYAVTEQIDEQHLLEPPEFEGHPDPHVWMDVTSWSLAVEAVAEALSRFDPDNAEDYGERSAEYVSDLTQLDDYVTKVIHSIPEQQRVLITAHDAFNYFGRRYDIRVKGIQGISTESEAGVERINELVQFIVESKIQAVFVESSVPQKNVRALIEGANQQGWEVSIGGELFSDAMGESGTYEGTYVGMIDHNATTIAIALGGAAPPDGLNGKLAKHHP